MKLRTTNSSSFNERNRSPMLSIQHVAACFFLMMCSGIALAQATPNRKVVATADISVPGREAILSVSELGGGTLVARHTHPGDEIAYVIEGELQLLVEGQSSRIIRAGEGFVVPGGVVHSAVVVGTTSARIVATHVVEKGKPLRTTAP